MVQVYQTILVPFLFIFAKTTFRERCGDTHNVSLGFVNGTSVEAASHEGHDNLVNARQIYYGGRIAAGVGSVKVRARINDPNNANVQHTTDATILF